MQKVTAVTISKEQFDYSKKRIKDSGLESQVSIELCDYRDITGSYDRIVSIEMIEAVGEPYWPVYFSTLSKLLRPEGTAMLQAITVPDDEFEDYRSNVDFIQHFYISGRDASFRQEKLCNILKRLDFLLLKIFHLLIPIP